MKFIFRKFLLFCLLVSTLTLIIITILFQYYWTTTPPIDLSKLETKNTTILYDLEGNELAHFGHTYHASVSYEEIPKEMIEAIISIEDKNFFQHNGIDLRGIMRATIINLKSKGYAQGASTITQQLIKNVYLTQNKSLSRKREEIFLAMKLESLYAKEQILEAYLNHILFGGKIYGIKMAVKYYFDKEVQELTTIEAATLAGMIQMPNKYNPFVNPEQCEERRNVVLSKMFQENYISEGAYQTYLATPLSAYLKRGQIDDNISVYSNYFDYVFQELQKVDKSLYQHDLKITIPMNPMLQSYLHRVMSNETKLFPDSEIECGVAVIENKTGHILGLGGSREIGLRTLNYATDVRLQPASTIKPLLDYAPAIEYLNYSPGLLIKDEPYFYYDGQQVYNWDLRYKGDITIRQALAESRNIPAIKLFKEVGYEKAFQFVEKLGLKTDEFYHDSMAIGGFQYGFTVLEMASAFSAFPNMGIYHPHIAITEIDDGTTQTSYQKDPVYAMKESTAFFINDILHDVLKGTRHDLKNKYFASKTGQSNFPKHIKEKYGLPDSAIKDAWTIGYTKDLTVACWVGYNSVSSTTYIDYGKVGITKQIVYEILSQFSKADSYPYPIPSSVKRLDFYIEDGMIYTGDQIPIIRRRQDYFHLGYIPKTKIDDEIAA